MHSSLKFYLVFSAFMLSGATAAHSQEAPKILRIEADAWCPVNCDPAASAKLGIGIDLAKKIFEPMGYTVQYTIVPWTRALQDVRAGRTDAVIGANTRDDPHLVFPQHAISNMTDDFYVLKGNPWRYQGIYTLKGKHVGIVADYGYGDVVTQFIAENKKTADMVQVAAGNDALQQNITKLTSGKIDLIIESRQVMEYTLRTMQMEDKMVWAGGVPQLPVYLAFSPARPQSKELAAEYDAGISKLTSASALNTLYGAYGLQP